MDRMLRLFLLASTCFSLTSLSVAATLNPTDASAAFGTEAARKSGDLFGFVGVQANLNGTDAQWQATLSALRTLGVQHVRDAAATGAPQAFFDRHAQVGALGLKSIFTAAHGTQAAALERFAARVSGDVEGLEAPSGMDASPDASWVTDLRTDLRAVHTSAQSLGLPTFGPTLSSAAAYSSLGDVSAMEEFAGVGALPCAGVAEQAAATCTGVTAKLQASLAGTNFAVSGAVPASATPLPPAVAAIYLPRVLLEEWNAGAKRSYRADLDVASTSDYALLDKTGAETPAFRALAGLLSLLKDNGAANFQPGSLAYSISGVDSSVHHALFAKSDGSFYLALWIEAASYDAKTRKMLTVPGQVAKLETAGAMSMRSYQFDETGAVTSSTATPTTPQMVPVSDRVLVLELTPAAAAGSATASTEASVAAFAAGTTPTAGGVTAANSGSNTGGGQTYYVSSSSGDDGNDGLSSRSPWKTIAKVNASTSLYLPGTSILLKRGDVFRDDYVRLMNKINAGANTTAGNTPLPITGTATQPIVIGAYGTGANPVLDGADPLQVTWTRVTATTWKATVASLPSKVYVDSQTAETEQLLPQANGLGAWKANTPYHYLDLVVYNGLQYVVYGLTGTIATPSLPYGQPYVGISGGGPTTQKFSSTASGLTNVENTPGSWYGTGKTVYVHLLDGSNPNNHVIEGSNRPYGVLLTSVNYVTVENLTVERPQMIGFALVTWTDNAQAGHYMTNEYNSVINSQVWNWGTFGGSCVPSRHVCAGVGTAGILSQSAGNAAWGGLAIHGTVISGNYVGRSDQYFGLRTMAGVAGIEALGQNGALVTNNRIVTINNQCLNYQAQMGSPRNVGGEVSYNYCGNNQGNYFFGQTTGGRIHHNIAANSYGEGIQVGGDDTGSMIDHNLLYNLGRMASTVGYNGIDCNGGGHYLTMANNTIVNVWGASITLEAGCDHAYVVNNVLDFPPTDHGTFYYYLQASFATAKFNNNLYNLAPNVHPWLHNYRLAQWKVVSGETDAVQADPVFVNAAIGDYRLASSSAGVGSSVSVSGTGASADDASTQGGAQDQGADLSAASYQ